jgi:uncharacterized protein (TIGR02246 family)
VLRILAALGLTVVVGACAPATAPDTRAQDEAAIRAAETAWSAAAQAKDLEKAISYYAPDGSTLAPNEPRATGTAEIRKAWDSMLSAPGMNLSWTTGSVDVARSGDMAYSTGAYTMSLTGPDGKPMSDRGKYATIWKKQADGNWKAVVDVFNSDLPLTPPAPPPPAAKKK